MIENTKKLQSFISSKYENKELDNTSLVQLIELLGRYLNLKTISDYAKENGMSYNGVKKCRNIVELLEKSQNDIIKNSFGDF